MNTSKSQIIKILSETSAYVSGEDLSEHLGISRAGVWKHIKQLRDIGYTIDSVRNKGHRLISFPDRFVLAEVSSAINKLKLVDEVFVYDSIDSTNEEAKRLSRQYPNNTLLVISEEQVSGKGRRGRQWSSPPGTGIYMSLLLHPDIATYQAPQLTLLAGLAVNTSVQALSGQEASIKWPNDIVIGTKKISGILTEMSTEMNEIDYVILGIGINVNQRDFPEDISSKATSLKLASNHEVNRKELLTKVLEQFTILYKQFIDTGNLDFMIEAYNKQCVNVNKLVQVERRGILSQGFCKAVLANGGLEIEFDGQSKVVHSGEVSVRGLYGYVDN